LHIHILGICGTFMGGLALIARELGHQVSGSDANVYPPMSSQLQEQGIALMQGYRAENLTPQPDLVIIGNALSRGNVEVEAVLNLGLPYISGAQWLSEHVLQKKWVLAVAGTHGKTTTTSMLSWILEHQGFKPGFLVGGIPLNFGISARLGETDFFVVEADEYDCAFFDKRSKFVHYRPRTLILNNLEYDHADIFPDLEAIKRQFHHLIRTVPSQGLIIAPQADENLSDVLQRGCWTPVVKTALDGNAAWTAQLHKDDGSAFAVLLNGQPQGTVNWALTGEHNVFNALSALAAAHHVGILVADGIAALTEFQSVKRRMEVIATINGVTVYDDFAHHPTAIKTTLSGLRKQVQNQKIIAVIELRSNTMRMGVHSQSLADSLNCADIALIYQPPTLQWDVSTLQHAAQNIEIYPTIETIIQRLQQLAEPRTQIVLMSNGSFGGIYQALQTALAR
jgi:UDP-N-acetylmuramate: L-alanyl-gamma-D-glutamyl-meso-diaminopimelate ligase